METLCETFINLLQKPEEYLRPSDKQKKWVEQTRKVYNFVKQEEEKYNLPASQDSLERLNTDGLDTEQIWQLFELQNKALLSAADDLDGLNDVNLFYNVAKLSSLAKYDKLLENELEEEEDEEDSLVSDDGEEEEKSMDEDSDLDEKDEGMGSSEDLEESDPNDNDSAEEDDNINGLNLDFDNDSENEEDDFDQVVAKEGMEDSDSDADDAKSKLKAPQKTDQEKETDDDSEMSHDDDDDDEEYMEKKKKPTQINSKEPPKKFQKTQVDSKFFRLRECEFVADNDMIGENYNADSDDIDLMEDISDGEEAGENVKYKDFFDGPSGSSQKSGEVGKEDESDNEDMTNYGTPYDDQDQDVHGEDTDGRQITQLLGSMKTEEKSSFEKEREREQSLMNTLEDDNIGEKPWFLKGEAVGADRPENSTLEEHLEYNIVARQRPVITEDTTALIEKIILGRVRSKSWNDVTRVVKPNINPREYKKKLLLDQEKSKKSLAEIYEEEYIKQREEKKSTEKEEELPEHKEIREKMDSLFGLLDALANYHYTPRMHDAEVKIQSNMPAVSMEETTPVTASDATLLAPQEILAPSKGDLKGATELTDTDRLRARRKKKMLQSKKAKNQKKKLDEKLKNGAVGLSKRHDQTAIKFIEKAVKAGQIKMLDGDQGKKAVRSSQTFFKELQATKHLNPRKKHTKGKNKEETESAARYML